MNKKLFVSIISAALLSGCATNLTMTGKAYPSVQPTHVKILFKDRPKCSYEELGFVSTPPMWNQNTAIQAAREKAAEVGADYFVVETVHLNDFNDAKVSGMAYKCGTVDRDRVEINAGK